MEININRVVIHNKEQLHEYQKFINKHVGHEEIPYAAANSLIRVNEILPDRFGLWKTPLIAYISEHSTSIGYKKLNDEALKFLSQLDCDILSLNSYIDEKKNKLILRVLIRNYSNKSPDYKSFYASLGEDERLLISAEEEAKLIIPSHVKEFHLTEKEIKEHNEKRAKQDELLKNSTKEKPLLNYVKKYIPKEPYNPLWDAKLIYDLKTADAKMDLKSSYETFTTAFRDVMDYVSKIEYNTYITSLQKANFNVRNTFKQTINDYIINNLVNKGLLPIEDVPTLKSKLNRALYQLYIVQDLIDDKDVTDIKICNYDDIRVRVGGKAYLTNITFVNEEDYMRFIDSIVRTHNIDERVSSQTFTGTRDENYILRFSLNAPYINASGLPTLHIRKVSRKKLMDQELLDAGMFTEVIRDFLLDAGKNSRGVVFAGPPGSGKTVLLNWFLERAYEESAEILVIQENDELFSNRKGIMFEHVVNNPPSGYDKVDLESLGKMALVAGANVFVIGETKGGEICSAITLSNSGCRTSLTIHADSAEDVCDKMADLAMRGYAKTHEDGMRMLKSFQTIVYLENFHVAQIVEIKGYNEEKKDMDYQYLYNDRV